MPFSISMSLAELGVGSRSIGQSADKRAAGRRRFKGAGIPIDIRDFPSVNPWRERQAARSITNTWVFFTHAIKKRGLNQPRVVITVHSITNTRHSSPMLKKAGAKSAPGGYNGSFHH